jgi:hypothetical protein
LVEFKNHELISRLLQTTIEVIGRRTSENYAAMAVDNVLSDLTKKYVFLKNIEIKNTQFIESIDAVDVKNSFNDIKSEDVARASSDFINIITDSIGEHAGFFFIREVKENLPFEYEKKFKNLGVDFDVLQMDFILRKSSKYDFDIENSEILRYVFSVLFDVLSMEKTQRFAFESIDDIVGRFSTRFDVLNYVTVNDVNARGTFDIVSVDDSVNSYDSEEIGNVIQKILQEVNNVLNAGEVLDFVEKFRSRVGSDYAFKLDQIGVNIKAIKMGRNLIVKRVIKSLIDVLSESTAESYAVMSIDKILSSVGKDHEGLNYIKIDNDRYSEGIDAVFVSESLDDLGSVEIGRSLQKLIEKVVDFLGEEAGRNFVERFKKRLGRAYVLRIEEMGVNLHMINLRQNLSF